MHQKVINNKTQRVLQSLISVGEIQNFYLAGGTALALQFEHRESIDLDFFSQKKFDTNKLKQELSLLGKIKIEYQDEKTLNCFLNNVKISFFYYPYKLLFPLKDFSNVKLADERDIACMKIDAASDRGSKKDFIDLYFLLKKYSLKELLDLFDKKYKDIKYNKFHILKSLIFFEQAEKEPMPIMLKEIQWEQVKNFFKKEIKNIIL